MRTICTKLKIVLKRFVACTMQQAPAADRNKSAILDVLKRFIPETFDGYFLEIASGTGQHVAHFAQTFTKATFQPSDIEKSSLDSIAAHISHYKLRNVKPPIKIDVTTPCSCWHESLTAGSLDIIYNANMIHISPWETAVGLFDAAGILLKSGSLLITYGPYAENGILVPESNVSFDASLRSRDPSWGVRDIKVLKLLAEKNGLTLIDKIEMPANNKTLIWKRTADGINRITITGKKSFFSSGSHLSVV